MICKRCGTLIEDTAMVCPVCGASTTDDFYAQPTAAPVKNGFSGMAIAGFVMSLLGLLIFALPFGILGIIFSSLGMQNTSMHASRGKGLSISGLIIGIIDVACGILLLL